MIALQLHFSFLISSPMPSPSLLFLHSYCQRCSQGMMGSRALSADSIFLADQVLTDAKPAKVLSQENVHGKIKALQV